jgi:Spy/CpxP family protein refolding chaperone
MVTELSLLPVDTASESPLACSRARNGRQQLRMPFKNSEETIMRKKSFSPVLVVVYVLLVCNLSIFALSQTPASPSVSAAGTPSNNISDKDIEMLRADLRAQRKQIMAQNMTLTADEATKFWPIFDQYRQAAIKANDERWAVIKDYAANYATMTDAQAQDYIKRAEAVDEQLLALRMRYVPLFEKVISAKKTALCYQIDRRIDLLINLQLSSVIPMVDTSSK